MYHYSFYLSDLTSQDSWIIGNSKFEMSQIRVGTLQSESLSGGQSITRPIRQKVHPIMFSQVLFWMSQPFAVRSFPKKSSGYGKHSMWCVMLFLSPHHSLASSCFSASDLSRYKNTHLVLTSWALTPDLNHYQTRQPWHNIYPGLTWLCRDPARNPWSPASDRSSSAWPQSLACMERGRGRWLAECLTNRRQKEIKQFLRHTAHIKIWGLILMQPSPVFWE